MSDTTDSEGGVCVDRRHVHPTHGSGRYERSIVDRLVHIFQSQLHSCAVVGPCQLRANKSENYTNEGKQTVINHAHELAKNFSISGRADFVGVTLPSVYGQKNHSLFQGWGACYVQAAYVGDYGSAVCGYSSLLWTSQRAEYTSPLFAQCTKHKSLEFEFCFTNVAGRDQKKCPLGAQPNTQQVVFADSLSPCTGTITLYKGCLV